MHSFLRKPLAAALLLSATAAVMAQPARVDTQRVVPAPAVVAPAPAAAPGYGPDHEHWDHGDRDRWEHRDRDGWRRDERAPAIGDLTPLPGERVGERWRMTVSAHFSDNASGVDPASVRLRIDGRDVTADSRIERDEVRFHNNLFPGRHVAEVVVRDRAGNTARRSWQFDVVDRHYGQRDRDGDGWRDGPSGWRR